MIPIQAQIATQHSLDVAIDHCQRFIESDAADRCGGVLADSRQLADLLRIARKGAVVEFDDLLCRGMEVSSAGVVSETCPHLEHFIERGLGQCCWIGELLDEAIPVGNHRRHPGLLQHHLGEPDGIRISHAAPRQ